MSTTRRRFVHSTLAAGFAGLFAASARRARAESEARSPSPSPSPSQVRPARHCIVLFMHGGASQIDTWDPKPTSENGGEFAAIESAVSGLRVSEHLPGLAARMQQLSLIRTLAAKEGNHERARYLMHTGFAPQGGVVHPGLGSHAARSWATKADELPGYVSIGAPGPTPGYLGAAWSAFTVPRASRTVRNLAPPVELSPRRSDRRLELWRALEDGFAADHGSAQVRGSRDLGERAVALTRSPKLAAFDLEQVPAATRARYGEHEFGLGCLRARQLVEAGVGFVEVGMRGWDTHEDNFTRVRRLSGELDGAMSALIDDLVASGKWSETLLVWLGDFGRTPRINERGGRDHFPAISSAVLGGGPIRAGQVVGSTSADGMSIRDRPVSVPDLFATLTTALGLAGDEVHVTAAGRPVTTVDEAGRPVAELL